MVRINEKLISRIVGCRTSRIFVIVYVVTLFLTIKANEAHQFLNLPQNHIQRKVFEATLNKYFVATLHILKQSSNQVVSVGHEHINVYIGTQVLPRLLRILSKIYFVDSYLN